MILWEFISEIPPFCAVLTFYKKKTKSKSNTDIYIYVPQPHSSFFIKTTWGIFCSPQPTLLTSDPTLPWWKCATLRRINKRLSLDCAFWGTWLPKESRSGRNVMYLVYEKKKKRKKRKSQRGFYFVQTVASLILSLFVTLSVLNGSFCK